MFKLKDSGLAKLDFKFMSRKPLVTARAIKYGIVRKLFDSDRYLPKIDIIYSYKCNFKCKHCFATALNRGGDPSVKHMDIKKLKKLADECYDLGVVNINFQGGEPLVWDNLEEIVETCGKNRFWFSVTSNGYMVTREKAKELYRIGIDNMIISVDSGLADEHDTFRRAPNSFDRAINALQYCIDAGLKAGVSTCVTRQSIRSEGLKRLMDITQKKGMMHTLIIATPAGEFKGNMDIMLTNEDLDFIEKKHENRVLLRRDIHTHVGKTGCRAVSETLYITAYGDVMPCPFIHVSLGNVFEEPLEKIRDRGLDVPAFKESPYKCLAGEQGEFMDKYISRTFTADTLPMDFEEFFKE